MIKRPYLTAFRTDNIVTGFEMVGLWPLNATRITPEMLAPSIATSTGQGFPLRPPSTPVRDLVQAVKDAMRVSAALELDTITEGVEALTVNESTSPPLPFATFQDDEITSQPLATGLAAVEALLGSRHAFLVNDEPLAINQLPPTPYINDPGRRNSTRPIVSPKKRSRKAGLDQKVAELEIALACANERIDTLTDDLQAANATSVMQHLHLHKLVISRAAGTKSGKNPALFTDGKGQELTGPAFSGRVHDADKRKEAEDKEKRARKATRDEQKIIRKGGEAAWKKYAEEWTIKKEEWNKKVSGHNPRKIPAHLMRIKPVRVLKKVVIANWEREHGYEVSADAVAVPPTNRGAGRKLSDEESEEFESEVSSTESTQEEEGESD
jgi:hypothetical protein